MLFIIRRDKNGKKDECTWRVGETKPVDVIESGLDCLGGFYDQLAEFTDVIGIQADGLELEYIQRNFSGIPMSTKPVVYWKGEIAQFIYDHLKYGHVLG